MAVSSLFCACMGFIDSLSLNPFSGYKNSSAARVAACERPIRFNWAIHIGSRAFNICAAKIGYCFTKLHARAAELYVMKKAQTGGAVPSFAFTLMCVLRVYWINGNNCERSTSALESFPYLRPFIALCYWDIVFVTLSMLRHCLILFHFNNKCIGSFLLLIFKYCKLMEIQLNSHRNDRLPTLHFNCPAVIIIGKSFALFWEWLQHNFYSLNFCSKIMCLFCHFSKNIQLKMKINT